MDAGICFSGWGMKKSPSQKPGHLIMAWTRIMPHPLLSVKKEDIMFELRLQALSCVPSAGLQGASL